jgi:hypothetical protein
MKTRSLGIAFAALLALAPVRGSAQDAASPAAPAKAATPAAGLSDSPASVPRPSIVPKTAEPAAAPAATDATPSNKRRYARHHYRRHAYWEPFPVFWPRNSRHGLTFRRVAWFNWF